jgi:hypothetical protein
MNPTLAGALKSKTMWAGAIMLVLSNLAPVVGPALAVAGVSASTTQLVGSGMSVLMMLLRTVTNQSLADKGASNVAVPVAPLSAAPTVSLAAVANPPGTSPPAA